MQTNDEQIITDYNCKTILATNSVQSKKCIIPKKTLLIGLVLSNVSAVLFSDNMKNINTNLYKAHVNFAIRSHKDKGTNVTNSALHYS